MSSKPNNALYYPTIEFSDYQWLWSAALLWDRIYRIVPKSYVPEEPPNIKKMREDDTIGIFLPPDDYTKEVSGKFIEDLDVKGWDAAALTLNDAENLDYARLHPEKVDVQLRNLIIQKGMPSGDGWLHVPTDFAGVYMTYLAKEISEKNDLQLVSDFSAAWTGTTYFKYDGQLDFVRDIDTPYQLANIIIYDFIPQNILSITPEELINFRKRRIDERRNFMKAIKKTAAELSNCGDPKILRDLIEDQKREILKATKDYKDSADLLNVKNWVGLKSLSFPLASIIVKELLPSLDKNILSVAGITIGIISGIANLKEEQRRLSLESDYSYLVHLNSDLPNRFNQRLWEQVHEFIDD